MEALPLFARMFSAKGIKLNMPSIELLGPHVVTMSFATPTRRKADLVGRAMNGVALQP